jgi:hypothetical protein
MLTIIRNHGLLSSETLAVAALSLPALAVLLSPATAQCLGVDLGLVSAGLGLPSAFSHPYYYGYLYAAYPAYPYPYYNAYYPHVPKLQCFYPHVPNPSYSPNALYP